jgi:mannose-1-phosphate guanylyltransferase
MIDPEKTLLVLTATHEPFFRNQVGDVPPSSLLIQPQNRGTSAAILYSLMRIRARDSQARVAIFPSDHYFLHDDAFAGEVRMAFSLTESHPEMVILLGIEPETPETSYGWIEPGPRLENPYTNSSSRVNRFWEKPSRTLACKLMCDGCLWNSFVMVGRVGSFLNLIRLVRFELLHSFESICDSLSGPAEQGVLSDLYARIPSSSFSDDVLSISCGGLAVLRCSALGWSDLGEPLRVLSILSRKSPQSVTVIKPSRGGSVVSSASAS